MASIYSPACKILSDGDLARHLKNLDHSKAEQWYKIWLMASEEQKIKIKERYMCHLDEHTGMLMVMLMNKPASVGATTVEQLLFRNEIQPLETDRFNKKVIDYLKSKLNTLSEMPRFETAGLKINESLAFDIMNTFMHYLVDLYYDDAKLSDFNDVKKLQYYDSFDDPTPLEMLQDNFTYFRYLLDNMTVTDEENIQLKLWTLLETSRGNSALPTQLNKYGAALDLLLSGDPFLKDMLISLDTITKSHHATITSMAYPELN